MAERDGLEFFLHRPDAADGTRPPGLVLGRRVVAQHRLADQIGQADCVPFGEGVGDGQGDHLGVVEERRDHQVVPGDGSADPGDVGAAVGDGGVLLVPFDADGVDRDLRVLRGEPLDYVGDDDAGAEGDGEGGAGGPAGGLDASAGRGGAGEERLGFAGEGRARRGQRDLVTVPLEQLDPEVRFEGLDRAAERGLGEQQFPGRPAEVQMVRHGEEVTELAQVELGAQVEVPGLPGHA